MDRRTSAMTDMERRIASELRQAERTRRMTRTIMIAAAVGLAMVLTVIGVAIATRDTEEAKKPSTPAPSASAPQATPAEKTEQPADPLGDEAAAAPAQDEAEQTEPDPPAEKPAASTPKTQKVAISIGEVGYEPFAPQVKSGAPVTLTVAQGEGCAAGFLIPELGISADNSSGPAKIELPALEPGVYKFTCGMEMVEGRLVVE